jgi:hypothetical protein
MKDDLDKLLKGKALKGREIAKELRRDKTVVNSFLHYHSDDYEKDEEHRWRLRSREVSVQLPSGWVDAPSLESNLRDATSGRVITAFHFTFDPGCKLMFDAIGRLLAVANQACASGRQVSLDFTGALATKNYLNRAGFFDHLDRRVNVLPKRPKGSAAQAYQGQSDTLVELASIRLKSDNSSLVEDLCGKFVSQSSKDYLNAATTMFGELINNVREHSDARTGFAGFQKYSGRKPHIQTVVSDDGMGIATTLRTTLEQHHPRLYAKYGTRSVGADVDLVVAAVRDGEVSRFGKGRGLGLKSSHQQVRRFGATFSVRQEEFCLTFAYQGDSLVLRQREVGLFPLSGTHICFDFFLA